jgi:hypothetical protein
MNLNRKRWLFTIIGLVITGVIIFANVLGLVFNTKMICGIYLCFISIIINQL